MESELQSLRVEALNWGVQQGICELDECERDSFDQQLHLSAGASCAGWNAPSLSSPP